MGLKEKVTEALRHSFQPDHIQLYDENGIYGIVVSTHFRRMQPLRRQKELERALGSPSANLSKSELRRILGIAPLTPVEFAAR